MVQREIADRLRAAPGSRTYGSPSVARPARLRGEAAAHGRPGRVPAAAAGRVGDPRPAPHRARRRRRRRATWSAPPSPTAASRWPARSSTARPGSLDAARAALAELGLPEDARAEALSPEDFAALSAKLRRLSRQPMLIHAPAKLNLCLYLGAAPRGRPARALLAVRAAGARRRDRGRAEAERDEVLCPGVEGENLAARALAGAARAGLGARRRCGSRSRSGSRSRPGSAAAAPTPRRCCGCAARRGRRT